MLIIHTADLHLGSNFKGKLSNEKSAIRRSELRQSFSRLIGFAREKNIRAIILSGDVFDSDIPLSRDKSMFYSAVRENPDISFYYLRGNHDIASRDAENVPDNLYHFDKKYTSYELPDGTVLTGIELDGSNSSSRYSELSLDSSRKNIVIMHGTLCSGSSPDGIALSKLADKGIDYLALGHIHSYARSVIDERGIAVYPGCLEGRGFDECGEKGFVLLDTADFSHKFVPFALRKTEEVFFDVSSFPDAFSVYSEFIRRYNVGKDDIFRIFLEGEYSGSGDALCEDLGTFLMNDCFFAEVKNKTRQKTDHEKYRSELSLRGEFIRTVSESGLEDDDKARIISCGLSALEGRSDEI